MVNAQDKESFDTVRRMHRILTLHFIEGKKQIEIAETMGISVASVNRIIKQGRDLGMVEITIRSPFQSSFDIAAGLLANTGLVDAIVAPCSSPDDGLRLKAAGRSAAAYLVDNLQDGMTICISGGKGVSALVAELDTDRKFDVTVVPATGGVQGKHYTDVNHLASEMAVKLGGKAFQIHAPMFASSPEERDALMRIRSCEDILDKARNAQIAVVGVGSIHAENSSYFDLTPGVAADIDAIEKSKSESEILAHLLDGAGQLSDYRLNGNLVGMTPEELKRIPFSMGVAAGSTKVEPLISVLRGGYLKQLVTDEMTAISVLEGLEKDNT